LLDHHCITAAWCEYFNNGGQVGKSTGINYILNSTTLLGAACHADIAHAYHTFISTAGGYSAGHQLPSGCSLFLGASARITDSWQQQVNHKELLLPLQLCFHGCCMPASTHKE
jgi:hypothetical protein